jgi:hypothetical protein
MWNSIFNTLIMTQDHKNYRRKLMKSKLLIIAILLLFTGLLNGCVVESDFFRPEISVDPLGNTIVAWVQEVNVDEIGMTNLWVNRYDTDEGWSGPELIEGQSLSAFPQVAVSPSGKAVIVWNSVEIVEDDDNPSIYLKIYSKTYSPGEGWGEKVQLSESENTEIISILPQLAIDSSGNTIVAWTQILQEEYDEDVIPFSAWVKRYDSNTGWEDSILLSEKSMGSFAPMISLDPSGNAIVAYRALYLFDFMGAEKHVKAKTLRLSGDSKILNFNLDKNVLKQGSLESLSKLNISTSNIVRSLTREEALVPSVGILAKRYDITEGWKEDEILFASAVSDAGILIPTECAIANDSPGNVSIVWIQENFSFIEDEYEDSGAGVKSTNRFSIQGINYKPGTGWGEIITIAGTDDVNTTEASNLTFSMNASGKAIITWTTEEHFTITSREEDDFYDDDDDDDDDDDYFYYRYLILAKVYNPAQGWDEETVNVSGTTCTTGIPASIIDDYGNTIIVWTVNDEVTDTTTILASRYLSGKGWNEPVSITGSQPALNRFPKAAVDSFGRAIVTWQRHEAREDLQNKSIWINRFE